MIDLHCHLHPGVDDGPMDDAEAVDLARALVDVGVTTAACTSHVRPDKDWMNTRAGEAARAAKLTRILAEAGVALEVVRGAEHYVDDAVFGSLETFGELCVPYGDSRWVLVETPYLGEPAGLPSLLHGLRRKGWRVLLAHVERFPYLSDKIESAQKLVDAGLVLQVNLGSLAGAYNRAQMKNAERLLKAGLVGVLAGDCHRQADVEPNIVEGRRAAVKLVGEERVRALTVDAPRKILADAPPEQVWP